MNPMKWLRKNNKKLMAIVVVLIMIAFTVPTLVRQWGTPGIKGNQPIAHYYSKQGFITNDDLRSAQIQLQLLRALGADMFLMSRVSILQTADVPALALAQILFAESRLGPAIDVEIKRVARQQQLNLTDWQIDEFFRQESLEKPEVLWLLLKAEARKAGLAVSNRQAGAVLKAVIPQLPQMKGSSAEELLKAIMNRQGIDQDTILSTFADLLAVLQYGATISQNEDVTIAQLKYETLRQNQTMDVEAVICDPNTLIKKAPEPNNQSLLKQFNEYKAYAPLDTSAENPYGFGYKQPPRARLEWMIVVLADVEKQVPVPTAEQTEEYYQRNQSQFTREVPSDPNDPNSPKVAKLQSYAEVAAQISKQLLDARITERADNILNDAREAADANLATANVEKLTSEQMAKLVADYDVTAEKVGKKYGLTIHTGKTGFVSPEDVARNDYFSRLYMTGQDKMPTWLMTMVFAIDELNATRLGLFAPVKPRMFESIGPLRDFAHEVVALVRVVGAEKAAEPCSIELTYPKKLPLKQDSQFAESNDVYAVKDDVKKDVKKLEMLPTAKKIADTLVELSHKEGWDKALEAINKEYGVAAADSNQAKTFTVNTMKALKRISEQEVRMARLRGIHDPLQMTAAKKYLQQKELIDTLYSLVLADPNKSVAKNVPTVMEFKPSMRYYAIKSMSHSLVDPNTYQQNKDRIAFMLDYVQSQSLGFEHFRADSIIERLNFQWDEKARNIPLRPEVPPEDSF
jgi:hypothetical protein